MDLRVRERAREILEMAIRRLARIPAAAFDASNAHKPVVVQGLMDTWPARNWTLDELQSRSIQTIVPVEVSNSLRLRLLLPCIHPNRYPRTCSRYLGTT